MTWKVGDLCVANHFGQWFNSKIRSLDTNLATVEFFGSNDVADIIDGGDVAADVPISTLKPFGPFAVNKKGELTTSGDSQPYRGEWKVISIFKISFKINSFPYFLSLGRRFVRGEMVRR